jgi:hypothetical protein
MLCLRLRGCVDSHDVTGKLASAKFGDTRAGVAMLALENHHIVDDFARQHYASHGFHMPQSARTVQDLKLLNWHAEYALDSLPHRFLLSGKRHFLVCARVGDRYDESASPRVNSVDKVVVPC